MQNKIFLPLIMGIITCNAYGATTMNGNVGCDTNVFGNNAELKANWSANAIDVNFYNETEEVSKKTCEYDGILELPEQPTKPGYQFIGWKIRSITPAEPKITSITDVMLGDYLSSGYLNFNGGGTNTYNNVFFANNSESRGKWLVIFNNGTVYGEASCSEKSYNYPDENMNYPYPWDGDVYIPNAGTTRPSSDFERNPYYSTNPWSGNEIYCWCRMFGYTPKTEDPFYYRSGEYTPVSSGSWVFKYIAAGNNYLDCRNNCVTNCVSSIKDLPEFRAAVFDAAGVIQQ